MSNEHVLSVWIGDAGTGLTTVQTVSLTDEGRRAVTRYQGDHDRMHALVHELSIDHDLVPIWEDDDGTDDGARRRPPAPFYTSRDLAPPTHLAAAS